MVPCFSTYQAKGIGTIDHFNRYGGSCQYFFVGEEFETMAGRMDVINRITELMENQGISQKSLEEYLGVSIGSYHNWKRNKGNSYFLYIDRIAEFLNVSLSYLITGKDDQLVAVDSDFGRSPDELELLKTYHLLNRLEKRHALQILKVLAE